MEQRNLLCQLVLLFRSQVRVVGNVFWGGAVDEHLEFF